MTKLYRIALAWFALGTVPIPLMYRSKVPKIRWQEFQNRPPTDDELQSWFGNTKLVNMAVITGWHGLTVLDFDSWDVFSTFVEMFGFPETYMVKTGRGVHAYYFVEEPVRTMNLGAIDIKGQWGYVLVPPSLHPSGVMYQALYKPKHIQRVDRLTDILPESMLPRVEVAEPGPASPTPEEIADPWISAQNPRQFSSEGLVAGVLSRYRIEDFFPDREKTSRDGRYWIARCPFHDDHNPSFWIDTKEQKGGCYAGCTAKAVDVINIYARLHGLSNEEALRQMVRITKCPPGH